MQLRDAIGELRCQAHEESLLKAVWDEGGLGVTCQSARPSTLTCEVQLPFMVRRVRDLAVAETMVPES